MLISDTKLNQSLQTILIKEGKGRALHVCDYHVMVMMIMLSMGAAFQHYSHHIRVIRYMCC